MGVAIFVTNEDFILSARGVSEGIRQSLVPNVSLSYSGTIHGYVSQNWRRRTNVLIWRSPHVGAMRPNGKWASIKLRGSKL